jgi:GDPmannose 4,6-dehydratase
VQHIQQNCIGVLYQLEAIRKHSPDTRYFNMGTSEEFGCTSDNGLQNESTIINPKSPYGASKAAARYLINIYRQSYNLYAVQNWTYNFESELRGYQYVTKKVTLGAARIRKEIDNNKSITPIELGNLDSVRSWQFAGDVADSIWKSLNNPLGPKDYVVASSNCNTIRELVEKAFAYANIPGYWQNNMYLKSSGEVLVCTNPKFVRPSDVTFLKGDSSLIQKELGWKSTLTFDQLVKRMVEYDLNHANFDCGILS